MNNYEPGANEIVEVLLYNFEGKVVSLMENFNLCSIQEDLFAYITTGTLNLIDSDNMIETFPIIGEEELVISYRTTTEFETVTRKFYVSSMSNKTQLSSAAFSYTLMFSSEEFMKNRSMIISRSFNNQSPSKIVDIILKDVIRTDKPVNIEDSLGTYSYIAPSIRPFEVINSMANKARSKAYSNGAAYLFFENKRGFNFVSLESLYDTPGFMYEVGRKDTHATTPATSFNIINAISVTGAASVIDAVSRGALGVKTKSLNLQSKVVTDVSYDYFDDVEYDKMSHVNKSAGKRLTSSKYKYKTNEGVYKFVIGKANDGSDFKNVNVAKRYAQLGALSSGPKVHIDVHMNSDLTVGDMIYLKIPTNSPTFTEVEVMNEEVYSSGNYLITCLRHEFGIKRGRTLMELSRDSYSEDHESNSTKTTPVTGSGR